MVYLSFEEQFILSQEIYLKYKWTSHLWGNKIFKQKMVYTIRTFLFIANH